jgi:hypothetical protein
MLCEGETETAVLVVEWTVSGDCVWRDVEIDEIKNVKGRVL